MTEFIECPIPELVCPELLKKHYISDQHNTNLDNNYFTDELRRLVGKLSLEQVIEYGLTPAEYHFPNQETIDKIEQVIANKNNAGEKFTM